MESLNVAQDEINPMPTEEDSIAIVDPASEENKIEASEPKEESVVECDQQINSAAKTQITEDAFLRISRVERVFSAALHYNPDCVEGMAEEEVQEMQTIVTFITESDITEYLKHSVEMELPPVAILGCPEKVCFTSKNRQDVEFTEEGDFCVASLFIPQSSDFFVKPFALSNLSIKDLEAVTYNSQITKGALPKTLKAIFLLQSTKPPLFEGRHFPPNSQPIINGAIMPIGSEKGPDYDFAVGFSIFANSNVKVYLYDINAYYGLDDDLMYEIEMDLDGKKKGFAIFLWTTRGGNHSDEPTKSSSRGTDVPLDPETAENIYNVETVRLLRNFKTFFPDIPVIGGYSPHIICQNSQPLRSSIYSSTLLVVAY